jgi:hypothetical protein
MSNDAVGGANANPLPLSKPSAPEAGLAPMLQSDGLPQPYLHTESEGVRFWVATANAQSVGAILSKQVLRYRFGARPDGGDALAIYHANRGDIEAAVRRRIASGSIEPIILRESDVPRGPGALSG